MRQYEVVYFAASVDDAETNKKFAESLDADFPILSDQDKSIAKAYGVLAFEGRAAARHTFYIGLDGTIIDIDREVKPLTAYRLLPSVGELILPQLPRGL